MAIYNWALSDADFLNLAAAAGVTGFGPGFLAQPASQTVYAGMTARFACRCAVTLLDWPIDQLPNGIDR